MFEAPSDFDSRDGALKQITRLGIEILQSHTCSIVLIDLERSVLTQIACASSNPKVERLLQERVVHIGSGQPDDWIKVDRLTLDRVEEFYDLDVEGQGVANPKTTKACGLNSMLSCPLIIDGQQVGRFNSFSTESNSFSKEQKSLIRILASFTGIILEKFGKEESVEKLELLSQLTMNMSRAQNIRDLLDVFLSGALHLVKAKNGLIRRLDHATGTTKVVIHSNEQQLTKLIELKPGEGITGLALKKEMPIRIADLRDPAWHACHVEAWDREMRAELAVPIILTNTPILIGKALAFRSGSKPIGVLNIESEEPNFFSELDEKCLWSLSQYAALMIERLETNETINQIERIESEIRDSLNYDDIIRILMRGITQTLGYEYANISIVEPELNCIRSKHVEGIPSDQIDEFRSLSVHSLDSDDIEVEVFKYGHIVVPHPDDERDSKLISAFHLDLLARVYVPMVEPSRNEVIGVLETGFKKEFRPYVYERDVGYLKRLVGYAAQALQRRRSRILDNLSHELRSPIIGIRNNATFLQRRLQELDTYKINAKFSDILADCQMLLYQAAELEYVLGLRSHTKSTFKKTLVHKDIIIKTINQLKDVVSARQLDPSKIEYRPEDAGRILISTDREKLNQVVYNLLINAIKYAEKDPKLFTVRVVVDENRDSFIVKFKDWGIGINKEYAHKIFDVGFRTPEARAIDTGTGLGLTISKSIMNELGGDLKLVGIHKPTEFHLIIPKQQRSTVQ